MPLPLKRCLLAAAIAAGAAGSAHAERLFVSNEKDNTVTVLDADSLKIIATVPVGQRPRGIVLSRDGKSLFICASDSDEVEEMDLATLQGHAHAATSGADPENFDISRDGKTLYIANENDAMVSFLDIASGKIDRSRCRWASSRKAWRSARTARSWSTRPRPPAWRISSTWRAADVLANVLVDSRPRRATWTPDGKQVWVSAEVGGTVAVIDAATHEIVHKIEFAIPGVTKEADPAGRASRSRRTARPPSSRSARPTVSRWSTRKSYEVKKYLLVGQRVWNLAFSPRRQAAVHHQRHQQRHVGDRRGRPEGDANPCRSGGLPWGVVVAP